MRNNIIALLLVLVAAFAAPARAQFCSNCVTNSAAPQNAQFNITSATIRGPLYVGSINLSSFTATSSVTASNFVGSGTYITNLNASQLLSGTVSTSVVSGNYYGITGTGLLSTGTWHGNVVGTQYGGTGSNLVAAAQGSLPYFAAGSTMAALAPGTATFLLQTNGPNANPAWTGAPQILGTNITSIPYSGITAGNIPMNWALNDASISSVSASKIIGSIPGNSANINGTLALSQLAAGTLSTSIAASSITVSGVAPGIWGGPNLLLMETIGTDGRITSVSQSSFTVQVGSITAGALPGGVTITPAQIVAGALPGTVIASSLTLTGAVAGNYGLPASVSSFTVRADGRLSYANNVLIALPPSQINSGTLPGGVLVPAASVQSGSLGGSVIASSIAVNGVSAGSYGGSGNSVLLAVSADGRITSATTYAIPGVSTGTAVYNKDNAWSAPQTFFSSVTVNGALKTGAITATGVISGDGGSITNITPAFLAAGTLNTNVIASSVSIPFLTVTSSVNASAFFGDGSHLTGVLNTGVYNVFTASQQVNAAGGFGVEYGITLGSAAFTSATPFGLVNGSTITTGGIVYFSSSSTSALPGVTISSTDGIIGVGSGITALTAANISTGFLGASVVASSIAVASIGAPQIVPASIVSTSIANGTIVNGNLASGSYGAITTLPSLSLVSSAVTHTSSVTVTGQLGVLVVSSITAKTFIGDGSLLTGVATNKFGFISATNQALGVGTFSFGYTNAAVTISSMSVIVTTSGTGGSSGSVWGCCYGGSCVNVTSTQGAAIGSSYTSNGAVAVPAGGQIVLQMTSTGEVTTPTINATCGYQ